MKEFKKKFGALCLALSALTWSIPNVARADFVNQEVPSVHNSGVDKIEDACEGYTSQTCDVVRTNADGSTSRTSQTFNCCGKTECENMLDPKDPTRCKVSRVFAHGSKETCTDPVQTSPCGMSCCGSVDCSTVCVNYRMNVCEGYNTDANGNKCCGLDDCEKSKCNYWTVTTEEMGTPGIPCCGYLDCANKACGGYTSTESKVFPDKGKLACCGKEDCEKMSCGGITETTGAYGGLAGLPCCGDGPNLEGVPNCRKTECQNYIETTSISDLAENKKKLECCGPGNNPDLPVSYQWGNCWQVHCDNQTTTVVEDSKDEQGKNGTTVACCGYADCLDKQCSGHTSYIPYGKGQESAVPCCGKKKCEQLYLESFSNGFDLVIQSAHIDYLSQFYANFNFSSGTGNLNVLTTGNKYGYVIFNFNGTQQLSIHNNVSTSIDMPFKIENLSPYAYIQYKDPYQSLIMPLNRNTSFSNKKEDICFGESTCYECPRPSYPCLTNDKVHGNLINRHLFIYVDDIGPDGAHEIGGLPVRFTLKNRDYNCTWRNDLLYHLPDVCSNSSCENGMPMDLAKSVCSQPYNYEEVTFTNYTISSHFRKTGSHRECEASTCYECSPSCHYVDDGYDYYVQDEEQKTLKVPTDVCSIQTITANYKNYDGEASPLKQTKITCDVPASYQSINREP